MKIHFYLLKSKHNYSEKSIIKMHLLLLML